ncbi:hypothetical protein ASE01_05195 [Nocardioides sp. Root190]|uniref:ECF transporter S component n=1 Tax=Nocardioides sp. Root190 TaxID=1736488 RepID=UPI0006F4E3CF|nr:ECF transporter S component [Nocardioides sp. Root190]KRB78647.1 hypothetical protein ASE01_05195 [Nocardioides sp. Root190]
MTDLVPTAESSAFDPITKDLQQLRIDAGLPSYNEIVLRITRVREGRGVDSAAARPARTTVYDAFRTGRRRMDPLLVGDIVRALGVPEGEVAAWQERVRIARLEVETSPAAVPEEHPAAAEVTQRRTTRRLLISLLAACVALNLLGRVTVDYLDLPIYLDMVGTAVSAVVLGPWWGALVGLVSNLAGTAISGPASLPFALVNVGGALVWGYGVRHRRFNSSLPRYFTLNLIVAFACTAIAAPIIVALGGEAHHRSDDLVAQIQAVTRQFVASVLAINLLMSMIDKVMSGFVALVVADVLDRPVAPPPAPQVRGGD